MEFQSGRYRPLKIDKTLLRETFRVRTGVDEHF